MSRLRSGALASSVVFLALGITMCDSAKAPEPAPMVVKAPEAPRCPGPPPSLLLAEAQFVHGADGKPKPGPALLTMWQKDGEVWTPSKLEDADSNVFHKAMPDGTGGIYTIGAEKAFLKHWTKQSGAWVGEGLWNPHWDGKFNRVRDLEIGDVTGDGKDDFVMATHDSGVLGVGSYGADGKLEVTELRKAADTFVHEIEICDVDGDGKKEFFATPSARNQSSGKSQPGQIVMEQYADGKWNETVLDDFPGSHAKEILCADVDGGGPSEFFASVEAETVLEDGKPVIKRPVEIRQYRWKGDKVEHTVIATIDDKQNRFLVSGDFDHDGKTDLIAAAMKTGLWFLTQQPDGTWKSTNFESNSSGFEHAIWPADLNCDGTLELYVASDEQRELRQYTWNPHSKTFDKQVIGPIADDTITWNITSGVF